MSSEEWIILKKKYRDESLNTSPPNTGFFASTLQRTKHNLSKFSSAFHHQSKYDKDGTSKTLNSSSTHSIGENAINRLQSSSSDTAFNGTNSTSYNHLPDILGFSRQQQLKLSLNNVSNFFLIIT